MDRARERIEQELDRVERLIGERRQELESDPAEEPLAAVDQHPGDQGTETFEREKSSALLEQLEGEASELRAALERVDDGTYGIDEATGEPIDPARLEALPAARTNVDGARRDERR